jgi:cytochrome c oxidase cbb3-type subunit I/II
VPYPPGYESGDAQKDLAAQSLKVVENLKQGMITNAPANTEIIALIAYLQRLGTDIKATPATLAPGSVPTTAQADSRPSATRN